VQLLEAEVVEIQAEAAVEAALTQQDEAALAGASESAASLPFAAMLAVAQEGAQKAMGLQLDTLARLAQVRTAHDLLSAQLAYGQRALALYTGFVARMARAMPAVPTLTGR